MTSRLETARLLREHARTFALTLRLLPRDLCEPLGIAYLLARISDTIADVAKIPRERRLALLEDLKASLAAGDFGSWRPRVEAGDVSPREGELIEAFPGLIHALEGAPDRERILSLWRTILEGQLFDLRRFGSFVPEALPLTRGELEHYCGLVAGSVGEFWTRLIAAHAPDRLVRPVAEMIPLGIAYGKGLQLVNILRDRAEDRALGRCYAGEEDLLGLFDLAAGWLADGGRYLSRLHPGRILMATALPHDLAVRTLAAIRRSPETPRVSMSRGSVRLVLLRNVTSLCFPRGCNPAS